MRDRVLGDSPNGLRGNCLVLSQSCTGSIQGLDEGKGPDARPQTAGPGRGGLRRALHRSAPWARQSHAPRPS